MKQQPSRKRDTGVLERCRPETEVVNVSDPGTACPAHAVSVAAARPLAVPQTFCRDRPRGGSSRGRTLKSLARVNGDLSSCTALPVGTPRDGTHGIRTNRAWCDASVETLPLHSGQRTSAIRTPIPDHRSWSEIAPPETWRLTNLRASGSSLAVASYLGHASMHSKRCITRCRVHDPPRGPTLWAACALVRR